MTRAGRVACIAILAAAAAVRILAARGDLWLDEIWSLALTYQASSPLGIITEVNHDNNHYLNGLLMYAFQDRGNWPGYRALSVLTGIGTVALAGVIAGRRGPRAALTAMAVFASSYVLILYASEARGYAPMIFFALATYAAIERYLERPKIATAALVGACAVLGILAHLLYVHFYLAAAAWTLLARWRRRPDVRALIPEALRLHAVPLLFGAAIYLLRVQGMRVGGGVGGKMDRSVWEVYPDSLGWTLSPPPGAPWHVAAALGAIAIFAVALVRMKDVGERVFFVGAIVVAPLLFFVAWPVVPYVRYFIVPVTFLLLLIAVQMSSLLDKGRAGKAAFAVAMALLALANARPIAGLLKYGRGHKESALTSIASRTQTHEITMASDHDLRVKTEVDFFAPEAFRGHGFTYYVAGTIPRTGPEWLILHSEPFVRTPPKRELIDPGGNVYRLELTVPTTELSGLPWFVYHNVRFGS